MTIPFSPSMFNTLPTKVGLEEGDVKECELRSLKYTPKSWHVGACDLI